MDNQTLATLDDLIKLLRTSRRLTKAQRSALNDPYRKHIFSEMLRTGKTYGEASGSPESSLFTRDETEFRARLRAIDNNLAEQVKIVSGSVEFYFKNGESPAPYYAWRIAVILRKLKDFEREAAFLEGFAKHFPGEFGGKYQDIAERATKARKLAEKAKAKAPPSTAE